MNFKTSLFVLGAAMAVASVAQAADIAPLATPSGITFQPLGAAQGYGPQRVNPAPRPYIEVVFANEKGLTLYTFDEDKPGKSTCVGDCATTWLPLTPLAKAKEVPGWTIIKRDDGRKQWAHDGKPVYAYKDDKEGGEILGQGNEATGGTGRRRGAARGEDGKAGLAELPKGWKVLKATTGGKSTLALDAPFGFDVKEVTDANGVVIVDARSRVLEKVVYFFNGDISKDKRVCKDALAECPGFVPVQAPELAKSGAAVDWTVIPRTDGIRQWAYKGKPLYTFEGDRITGDIHGQTVDKRWQLGLVKENFMPSNVSYRDDDRQGRLLTTSKGMTLYRRDLNAFNPASTQFAHNRPYRPRVGRMIRDVACNAACLQAWKPYLAPADAQPNGYWGISMLVDGKKQWTYKDYALYTFAGDKAPGDNNGDLTYDETMGDDPNVDNDAGFPALYKSGFNWGIAAF